jgi:PAS domain S-box-containing protein
MSSESKPYLVAFHRNTIGTRPDLAISDGDKPWERIFDHVSDLMYIVDEQYTITHLNHTMARHLGQSKHEITGRKCHEVIHGLNAPPPFCPNARRLQGEQDPATGLKVHELGGRYKKMSILPIKRINDRRNLLVHVVQLDSGFFQKYIKPIVPEVPLACVA